MPASRLLIGLTVLAAAIVLFAVLRPGDDGESDSDETVPTGAQPAATATEPGATETEPQEEPEQPAETEPEEEPGPVEPQAATLAIVVRGGVPEGGIQRLTVARGEEVRVIVRSDTVDEIHLHGYELVRAVGPGAPAQMRFRATVPGRFELETHERQVLIGEVEVRP